MYEGVSAINRKVILGLVVFISLLSFGVFNESFHLQGPNFRSHLGAGVTYLVTGLCAQFNTLSPQTFLAFAVISLFVNLLITALVVLRLLFFRKRLRATLGSCHGSAYTTVISMCIESAALVIVFSTAFLGLNLTNRDPFVFSRVFLIHIYVRLIGYPAILNFSNLTSSGHRSISHHIPSGPREVFIHEVDEFQYA